MDPTSILGLLNPVNWIERGVKYFRRPKLRLYFDPEETFHTRRLVDMHNVLGFFCHLMVSNDGSEVARNCAGHLIHVNVKQDDGSLIPHPDFLNPFVLKWAHEPDLNPRDIDPDLPRRLDLCLANQSQPGHFSFLTHRIPSGNRIDYPPGKYQVTVRVRSDNASSTDGSFSIHYGGVWDEFDLAEVEGS